MHRKRITVRGQKTEIRTDRRYFDVSADPAADTAASTASAEDRQLRRGFSFLHCWSFDGITSGRDGARPSKTFRNALRRAERKAKIETAEGTGGVSAVDSLARPERPRIAFGNWSLF